MFNSHQDAANHPKLKKNWTDECAKDLKKSFFFFMSADDEGQSHKNDIEKSWKVWDDIEGFT